MIRNDRRSPKELQELINQKIRIQLTSWEKRNIVEMYRKEIDPKGFAENCSSCWRQAIQELSKISSGGEKIKPILVKEKMIVHEPTVTEPPKDEVEEINYDNYTLKELRKAYPEIKATSKEVFIQKIKENETK